MIDDDPYWYKDAIIYELHVRAFQDSDGDGIGDFRGLTERLDYLEDLGVTAIWLLPFYPSPLRDDGYDISDYRGVHPNYGHVDDFERFVDEAHRRGLRVITELVINHTSDQHPWFQRARRAPAGSVERDFYVWTDAPTGGEVPRQFGDARIIFQDFEPSNWAWDPLAKAYYWHRFFSHQPDLNYDSPAVREAILPLIDFWMGRGVDGMRLDAVPYLFEREGTNCENLPETYEFLKQLRHHVDAHHANRMLLAEANQWPEDAAAYFGRGDACHMAFHFPLMPRMFMAIHMEDRFPILDILDQTPTIPDGCQWALFLRNHDELTLEMVTDEERDYMNRVYARDERARVNLGIRRRLAPLMGNNRRRIELMNALLFSLPGTPVLYYGDEIGMGDNIYLGDRNGVRTPMQWSPDRNAGFSRANPQRLYLPTIIDPEYHFETVNVESQQDNPHSLLRWMKRLIAQRRRYRAFGRGSLRFLQPENPKILAFLREHEDELILVVANLSRFVQHTGLDLSAWRGRTPVELFGRVEFPPVLEEPYFLTLGPHCFYWFALEDKPTHAPQPTPGEADALPTIEVRGGWDRVFADEWRPELEDALRAQLTRRQFGGDERRARLVSIQEALPVAIGAATAYLTLVQVDPFEGEGGLYQVPLAFAPADESEALLRRLPGSGIARVAGEQAGTIYDPFGDPAFGAALLEMIAGAGQMRGKVGVALGTATEVLGPALRGEPAPPARLLDVEQSNSALAYGDRLFLKLFRRIDAGCNPDLEIGRFLTRRQFSNTPPIAGAIEYARGRGEPMTLAILEGFVANSGDAWHLTLEALGRFFEEVHGTEPSTDDGRNLLERAAAEPPTGAAKAIGGFLESARLMGRRTAELHRALASDREDPEFAPEPFTALDQRAMYQSMRVRAGRVLRQLRWSLDALPEVTRSEAEAVLDVGDLLLGRLRDVLARRVAMSKIRVHGDYHLGQLLHTGKDFLIIDFEGESFRFLSERRLRHPALRDVAGLLNSFHYAAHAARSGQAGGRGLAIGSVRAEDIPRLEPWLRLWLNWVEAGFLGTYLQHAEGAEFLPDGTPERQLLLDAFLLERAVSSLGYELEHRPDWAWIPIRAILNRLRPGA